MRVDTTEPVVALTYDDGPHPEQTPAVLDELARAGARATFFVLSQRALAEPGIVRRMLAEGHEVGLHGADHTDLTTVPGRHAARLVARSKRDLEAVTGQRTRLYRPTYGAQGMLQYGAARALGMDVVLWTAWALDWMDDEAEAVAARAVGACHPGAIVLLHDATDDDRARAEVVALPTFCRAEVTRRILKGLADAGYTTETVGGLLARYPAVRAVATRRPAPPRPGRRRPR